MSSAVQARLGPDSSTRLTVRSLLMHLLLFVLVGSLGFGHQRFQPLWQDEVETAERARLILEGGLPVTIDAMGVPSVNAGGLEIEEGTLHRYSPWVQFYVGAAGLATGKFFQLHPDDAIRAPFIMAHALTATLLSFSLNSLCQFPIAAALGIGALYGLNSVQLAHNQTARYHALMCLVTLLALIALAPRYHLSRAASVLLGGCVLIAPHIHSLGGFVLLSVIIAVCIERFFCSQHEEKSVRFWIVTLSAIASLGALVMLTRPYAQAHWLRFPAGPPLRSIYRSPEILLSLGFGGAITIGFILVGKARLGLCLAMILFMFAAAVLVCDFHPYSQPRYYSFFPLVILALPLILPRIESAHLTSWTALGFALLLEASNLAGQPFSVAREAAERLLGTSEIGTTIKEPLLYIARHGQQGDSVLIDYVPQYVNWYLPGFNVALMPDPKLTTPLNSRNPVWHRARSAPDWHLWYPEVGVGPWPCRNACSLTTDFMPGSTRYTLISTADILHAEMCVVKTYMVDLIKGSPKSVLMSASDRAETTPLVLAKRCNASNEPVPPPHASAQ